MIERTTKYDGKRNMKIAKWTPLKLFKSKVPNVIIEEFEVDFIKQPDITYVYNVLNKNSYNIAQVKYD